MEKVVNVEIKQVIELLEKISKDTPICDIIIDGTNNIIQILGVIQDSSSKGLSFDQLEELLD